MQGMLRKKRIRIGCVLVVGLLCFVVGCGQENAGQGGDGSVLQMRLYCGAGLRPAVDELVEEFQKRAADGKIEIEGKAEKTIVDIARDYDGSERILARLELSKRGDFFLPGAIHYVDLIEKKGLVESKKEVCYFVPVILVQKGNPKKIFSLDDLLYPGIRLGIGNEKTCAIGRLVWKIFKKNGMSTDAVLKNVEYESVTVSELGNQIKMGTLDAVITWDAVAALYTESEGDGSGVAVPIPAERNVISTVGLGVLKTSEHPKWAGAFADFLTSPDGQAIWRKHHYTVEKPGSERPEAAVSDSNSK